MPTTAFAEDMSESADYSSLNDYINNYSFNKFSDYYIKAYDIDVKVNKDNTLNVTENITAYFNVAKHGIYRYIPIVNNVKQQDGSYKKINCKVSNVKAEDIYEKSVSNDNYIIQIGDPDKTVTGEKNYTVSYTFDMGKEANDGFDALYYNLIGTGWDTDINNVTFKITMPDTDFSTDNLSFYLGEYGLTNSDSINFEVNDNVISGSVDRTVYQGEALTVTLFLDNGYFTFNYTEYYTKIASIVAIPLLALIIVLILWFKFGRDKKIIDVVEFYPPENLNSTDVALWYKGTASREDTIGLLLELANEGYIEIIEDGKKGVFNNNNYQIRKVKEYNGDDRMKQIFFDGLFVTGNYISIDDLEDRFYKTIDRIIDLTRSNKTEVFKTKSLVLRFVGWLISIISVFVSCFITTTMLGGNEKNIACLIGIIIGVLSFIMSFFIRQRSDKGHELKQKINGFKIFLETAEKERLETLVNENPSYFYDILPYAYVLGVSDKWIKNFEGIALERPHWYYGGTFNPMTMYYFMHSAMPTAARAMTSVPQSSGSTGGGFSSGGGGFSGGGFGGGGGGSW